MPLVGYSLLTLRSALEHLRRQFPDRRLDVLTLSMPDVIAHPAFVAATFGLTDPLPLHPDSAGIVGWHKAWGITSEVVRTDALFDALGCNLTALDIARGRGGEQLFDLNNPLPEIHHQAYDLVYDCISNQVFNVGSVMAAVSLALRVGGLAFHTIPVCATNQGFYSVSPTAYHDFYAANGFELLERYAVNGVYAEHGPRLALDPVRRCRDVPEDATNVVVARKTAHVPIPRWPVMTKFKMHPRTLKFPESPRE